MKVFRAYFVGQELEHNCEQRVNLQMCAKKSGVLA